jgi:hypothetical protein
MLAAPIRRFVAVASPFALIMANRHSGEHSQMSMKELPYSSTGLLFKALLG